MKAPPYPASQASSASCGTEPDDSARLAALVELELLDTPPEPLFDAITAAAAQACGVPIALVSLVDNQRQWFKSNIGLPGVLETPREVAFCDHAIRRRELFEVPDATGDDRFAANPLVTGDPCIRFYAGAPIELPGGERIGTVCVIDRQPRHLDESQRAMLMGLGRIASIALVDRKGHLELHRRLASSEARYRAIVEDQSELISLSKPDGVLDFVNTAYARHYGAAMEAMVGRNLLDFVAPAERSGVASHLRSVALSGTTATSVNGTQAADGSVRWVEWTNRPICDAHGACTAIHSVGRDVTEQHVAQENLRAALRDKDTLLKEVYHRVKNNLQLVQSLLNLQSRASGDPAAQGALLETSHRIRAMALVHEKLYQSGSLASISLRDYAQELLRHIAEAAATEARGIELQDEVDDIECTLDVAIPFGLLLNELVFNALEHAFTAGNTGRIVVKLDARDGVPCLTVADDGIGLPPGFMAGHGMSMGLQLATSLARQLGGALEARSEAGSVFRAEMPCLRPQATA